MTVTTPEARRVLRRSLFWVGVIALAVVATLVTAAVFRTAASGPPLSASSPTPDGAKAVAEVLRQQGVTVTETDSLAATQKAVSDPTAATILVYDDSAILDDNQLATLGSLADNLVLVDPGFAMLQQLAPGVDAAGSVDGTLRSDCAVPAVTAAETVTGDGAGYRVDDGAVGATACLDSGDDVYSLVQLTTGSRTVTVLGTTGALSNEHAGSRGNAALDLGLLGASPTLVWYLPSSADETSVTAPTLGDLTPSWLTPLVLLGFLVAVAGAIWRGRRLGALVIENLPVTVRASETMEGRARLYAASGARLHALDALRMGTIGRLARLLGLPRLATLDEVAFAAAAVAGIDPRAATDLLVTRVPATDADLVQLSDELLRFEAAVTAALRPPSPAVPTSPPAPTGPHPDGRE